MFVAALGTRPADLLDLPPALALDASLFDAEVLNEPGYSKVAQSQCYKAKGGSKPVVQCKAVQRTA